MSRELDHLIGSTVGNWRLVSYLGEGNSAAVFRGERGSEIAAVKVFKRALVDEFGKNRQLERIRRELTLRGHDHPNLIQIFDGGQCETTGHLHIVMELINAPNLASVIGDVPRERIRTIISQVADAARYLETRDIVHRDIKPDNIAISTDFSKATLLDLGVIRPVDVSKLTESSDGGRKDPLGTLRYSPPEYIFRREKRDREGYRAITFYQLGAVLYDLITKERIFEAFSSPKARLVKAVEQELTKINQPDVPQELVLLADNCLLKDPERRLNFGVWEDFEEAKVLDPSFAARERVRRRFGSSLESISNQDSQKYDWGLDSALIEVRNYIVTALKDTCAGERMLPRTTTRELPAPETSSAEVQLIFEAAPLLNILGKLSILVTASVIDRNPIVLDIDVRAVTLYEESDSELERLRASQPFKLFRGVLNKPIVAAKLEGVIFRGIDFAQTAGSDPVEVNLAIRSEDANGPNLVGG